MKNTTNPSHAEVWLVTLDPTQGREQRGTRPCVIVSANGLNHGPADIVWVLPVTRRDRGLPSHVRVHAPEGGLREMSVVMCDQIRTISKDRLVSRWGVLGRPAMEEIKERLRLFLDL